jgi:hypothetical protein
MHSPVNVLATEISFLSIEKMNKKILSWLPF